MEQHNNEMTNQTNEHPKPRQCPKVKGRKSHPCKSKPQALVPKHLSQLVA